MLRTRRRGRGWWFRPSPARRAVVHSSNGLRRGRWLGGRPQRKRQMEASLTCAVCLSLFEEPVTLPLCSHNFCRPCVAQCLALARNTAARAAAAASSSSCSAIPVPCPLCRKPCLLPPEDGAASLPLNTTLAEVVKLFRAGMEAAAAAAAGGEEGWWALAPSLATPCEKHPGRPMELYCRLCHRRGCGQCVSEEHRGLFHTVNLVGTVYQEEKLAFFSNLKKIRELHESLLKEVTSPKDAGVLMQSEEEIIKTELEKVCSALEKRKKQLLEDLENQKKRKEKEFLIWKRMKEVHRKTIENVLNDCEKLLDECDPHHFLEVACSLNQRMKTQLDLMQMASKHENQTECGQKQMDTTSIVNDILALNLTLLNSDADKGTSPRGSVCSISANCGNKCEDKKNTKNGFCPVAGEDIVLDNGRSIPTQYMSISVTAEFGSMSHEELRYNYYMKHQVRPGELQIQTLNENHTLPKSLFSKNTSDVLFCVRAEAKNQKKLRMLLQRQRLKRSNFSDSVGFTFKTEAVNFNFSGSNYNLHQLNVTEPQNDSKEISLSKDTNSCLNAAKIPLLPAVTVPSETPFPLTVFPKVHTSAVTSAATLNLHSLSGAAEQPTAPLVSCSSGNLTTPATKGSALSFKKESEVCSTLFLGKPVTQDGNTSNINGFNSSDSGSTATVTTTSSKLIIPANKNPFFSAFSTNTKSNWFQKTKPGSSDQTSFSFISPAEKIVDWNKADCFSIEKNTGHNSLASSTVISAKDVVCNSSITSNLASKMSSSVFDHTVTSKKPTVPNKRSSKTYISPCIFSYKGGPKNDCDILKPFCQIEYANEKSKMKSKEKISAAKKFVPSVNDVPVHQEPKHLLVSCSSSSSIDSTPKSEIVNMFVPQENVICDPAFSSLASAKLPERSNTFKNHVTAVKGQRSSVPEGASCTISSNSDTEDLSQASSASDSSSTSERR
ncbi:uncharacterized protein LOC121930478 isoform X2 [Sceloporus undulatus]|uniref:uncharacterized protein LOC121930478 isoform X2 n=1 Tax=Sceloporus undulatus TaxID=8520 RepID=UPI001C4DD5F3|nr:uncharacterized protein LOC121930478 isoform X2 [Sceloporus undulatus]